MTEYVTPNIHTVLKKYQTSAPKSLQGPGHALPVAGCQTGPNCPLDATLTGVSGSGGNHTDLNTGGVRNLCSGHLSLGNLPSNSSSSSVHKISSNCPQIVSSQSCLNSPNAGSALPPVAPLIKKEVLSSPEPHELGEILPSQSLPLPLSMSSQTTQPQSQTVPSQPPVTTVKIIPPPPPELSQPIFTAPDSGSGVLYETRLEGKTIGCFSLGGEMRLCLPQFLNNVLADFTLDQINRIFDELGIYCSQCSPDQLLEFKAAKILPTDVKASGLITRTDAERLCAALLHRVDRNNYISDDDIPKGAISFKVYHRCFGKCDGICTPELYSYTKPTCIMCLECKGWFSPQKFVGHVHREVENRTCHWGFDSRNWHDYLHVALDVENREKYQKILDELKEVEIKEAVKAQNEILYMKRKHALHVDDEMLTSQMGHSPSSMVPPPHQQVSNMSDKQRTEMLAVPTKKAKGLEEAAAYQLEYQHYQSFMYAHCAQQQRIGSMSAFRPWAPKSFLHPAATYNAVAAFSTLPYLSQEPPVLQNPERVVRSTDRERFERTYQPNVALVPRKCVLVKDREKEHREYRERERDRERIERERDQERSREREKREQHDLERGRREREIQQLQQQHLLQQQTMHQQQKSAQELQEQVSLSSLCPTELKIKQERANTPNEIPQSPPLINTSGDNEDPPDCRINIPISDNVATLPLVSPISLTMNQQQRKMLSNNNSSSNSNSNGSSCHSDADVMLQQQQQLQEQQQQLQPRRHSLYTSNSSASSTSSTASTTPPQQQLLPAHLPPSKQYQQDHKHAQTLVHQEQQTRLGQSPRTCPLSPTDSHSSQEFSGSNEITSSTSPAPCNDSKHISGDNGPHYLHRREIGRDQPLIATVNQHAKLLPSPLSANFTANNNSNHNELHSRIRISKNLINRSNIMRSPTPPPSLPPTAALSQLHTQQEPSHTPQQQQLQPQLQILQQHQQQYEFYKHNQRAYDQQRQQHQHQALSTIQHQHILIRSQPNLQHVKHSPSQSSTTTGLNLSTNSTKVLMRTDVTDAQNPLESQLQSSYNGLPYVGSEFELSTDTDDDSVNGEADSSNILAPWDMVVEALRDTGPKERDRVLGLLRKVLHENQQLRYSNLQLSEMTHKRDVMIRELREQLRACRHHLQILRLQEPTIQSNGLGNQDGLQDDKIRSLPLKKSLTIIDENDFVNTCLTKETDVGENDNNLVKVNSQTKLYERKKRNQSENDQFSNNEDEHEALCNNKENDYDHGNGSDKESEKADNAVDIVDHIRSNADIEESVDEPASNKNDVNEIDIDKQPQAKRSRIESGSESSDSLSRTYAINKENIGHLAEHTSQGTDHDPNFDSEDEAPLSDYGNECPKNKNKVYTQISNTDLGDDEAETSRFTVTNGSSSDTNTSDDDGDESSAPLTSSQTVESDVQAPHSSSLGIVPAASTPLSPHSTATAGQLFDSSNSSDELSMKKAQMSASDALAKISESADDRDDLAKLKEKTKFKEVEKRFDGVQDSACDEIKTSDNRENVKAGTLNIKKEQICTRDRRFMNNSIPSGKSNEVQKATKYDDEKFSVSAKVNNNNICKDQVTRTPLATKASKKETPTTNTELWVKEEIM
ncbi:putative mediator of RNA polymerase II transcription subunit 26 [Bactrocera tryoni]|uniref:putative mediator of RNA polymerase II transcription subunit 26 n=1 Tax=Bactrocera tryoni TaxID=59916 RepID=UPI001A970830|nr:putative mediator of RNA polymerase II transcription subunit 26 [Bactrocera tryoni]XP_039949933.1 putative mediator of RNA polymerase II transcription subunit 26 [Bactrocera tryoni]XP_039949934.1 putative mediator of RNA polymerase II transcription subunit 26 [Bactrocera tryoni]